MKRRGERGPAAGIVGVGAALPDRVLTNQELEKMVDTTDEWIRSRTGISERRIAADDARTADLAAEAATQALADAKLNAKDIDLIIVATTTPDMFFPSTAAVVHGKIGASDCGAFDLAAACTGFCYGLTVAEAAIKTGQAATVLLIGADIMSRLVDWKDRRTCVLFGDGAGAVLLSAVHEDFGLMASYLGCDGNGADLLAAPVDYSGIRMKGQEIFKFAVRAMPQAANIVMERAGLNVDDVDFFIPHQANSRIITAASDKLGLNRARLVSNIHKYGNTSAASIPLAISELWESGQLSSGQILLFAGFGGGLTWGANLLRWHRDPE